jgi:hypothetical protein
MGRRARNRRRAGDPSQLAPLDAPTSEHNSDDGSVLELRGVLSAKTRERYKATLSGQADNPGAAREDAWQRGVELLFEHLAVRWEIAGLPITGQKELIARYRVATQDERRFVRDAMRAHLAEHFPELPTP